MGGLRADRARGAEGARVLTSERILERWRVRLRTRGFDLVTGFDTRMVNGAELSDGLGFSLPTFGRAQALALFVAHGRALWRPFVNALSADLALAESQHPLDEYTEACVDELRRSESVAVQAFYSHQVDPCIPFQRIADRIGLAELSPSHLSVHPRLGPWLGLRALVVFDAPPLADLEPGSRRQSLCAPCAKPCLTALAHAEAEPSTDAERWFRAWLDVRDSCPLGRAARYGERQLRYHYTKDRRALRE